MIPGHITIRGASEHNLQDLDLDLPHGCLVAISGVSGSGKTSLVFDTVFAEARRRYLLALGSGVAGLAQRLRPPRVRRLEGLAPAVAIAPDRARQTPRSTVATLAGVHDYLRLLFSRLGQARCLECGAPVHCQRFEEVYEQAAGLPQETRVLVLAPRRLQGGEELGSFLQAMERSGYRRVRVAGEVRLLDELDPVGLADRRVEVVVDRLAIKPDTRRRLRGSLEAALEVGEGQIALAPQEGAGEEMRFSVRPACSVCDRPFPVLSTSLFSFNSSQGACPQCRGLGVQSSLSLARVFDGGQATLGEFLERLERESGQEELRRGLHRFCRQQDLDPDLPVGQWPPDQARLVWEGTGKRGGFAGLEVWLERRRSRSETADDWLEEWAGDVPCPACRGSRLRPEALAVEVGGRDIAQVSAGAVAAVRELFSGLGFSGTRAVVGEAIAAQIRGRLEVLEELGLGYLGLDRRADSLSSGEFQRLRLGAALGSGLTQVLYVLDEPSAGLHARDVERLLRALEELRDAGNTVLLVEHDPALIRRADQVVDLGPGAGARGGRVVAQGTPAQVMASGSPTGRCLAGSASLRGVYRRPGQGGWLELTGACGHNLKGLDVAFPLGNLVCVTGVSGSGKSSLVHQTLYPILAARLYRAGRRPLPHTACRGAEQVERVVAVDQRPIGRTPRSNAATYTGLLRPMRQLFAELPESRLRGYRPAHFSFNAPEGACAECGGSGSRLVRQGGFEDVELLCPVCGGRRYRPEVLEVRYRGHSIAEVLDLSPAEALELFAAIPEVARPLRVLGEVGLGYLRLGQPATSLSGGEAQRVKLAAELGRPMRAHTLYLLDEPTIGLHLDDVRFLVELLQRLVEQGNTVLVVEHHLELIAACDWVIDLGPEGGEAGGRLVAAGPPRQVAQVEESWTGRFLRERFARPGTCGGETDRFI